MFSPGDDVVVTYQGEECHGEVIEHARGWVLAKVVIDPVIDWGGIGPVLPPEPQVMVREAEVRRAGDD